MVKSADVNFELQNWRELASIELASAGKQLDLAFDNGISREEEEESILLLPGPQDDVNDKVDPVQIPDTAHQVSNDSWFQVGILLSMGVNSAYALGYSGTIMVPLGWIGGVVGLILSTMVSLYASILTSKLHEVGGKRHIRYRDLAGYLYGRTAYFLVWALQYANLFLINIGYVIMAGSALKAFYLLFRDDHQLKLPHFIAIAGFAYSGSSEGLQHSRIRSKQHLCNYRCGWKPRFCI